jgi:hypothetical protein
VLAGIGAVHGLGVRLELLPPSGHLLRFVFRPQLWSALWVGMPSSLKFSCGFPGCVSGGVSIGGPLLVSGVAGFEALAFGGQLCGEGCSSGRCGWVVLSAGAGGLLEGVGFGLRGEAQLAADVGRGGGAGAFALKDSCFELAAVQAAEDIGFVADLQGSEDRLAHGFEFGVAPVRLGGNGLVGVGDPGGFPVRRGDTGAAGVFLAQRGGRAGGQDAELAGQPGLWAGGQTFAEGTGPVIEPSRQLTRNRRGGGCALRPRDVVPKVG